jgi:hypothetical protein
VSDPIDEFELGAPTQLDLPNISLPYVGTTTINPVTDNTYVIHEKIADGHFGIFL